MQCSTSLPFTCLKSAVISNSHPGNFYLLFFFFVCFVLFFKIKLHRWSEIDFYSLSSFSAAPLGWFIGQEATIFSPLKQTSVPETFLPATLQTVAIGSTGGSSEQ